MRTLLDKFLGTLHVTRDLPLQKSGKPPLCMAVSPEAKRNRSTASDCQDDCVGCELENGKVNWVHEVITDIRVRKRLRGPAFGPSLENTSLVCIDGRDLRFWGSGDGFGRGILRVLRMVLETQTMSAAG